MNIKGLVAVVVALVAIALGSFGVAFVVCFLAVATRSTAVAVVGGAVGLPFVFYVGYRVANYVLATWAD